MEEERPYLADVRPEALDTVTTEDEPDFERAEAASQAEVPVAVIYDEAYARSSAKTSELKKLRA